MTKTVAPLTPAEEVALLEKKARSRRTSGELLSRMLGQRQKVLKQATTVQDKPQSNKPADVLREIIGDRPVESITDAEQDILVQRLGSKDAAVWCLVFAIESERRAARKAQLPEPPLSRDLVRQLNAERNQEAAKHYLEVGQFPAPQPDEPDPIKEAVAAQFAAMFPAKADEE
jgi:hypothetical protein